jgi:6-pyruvoyltetrahydropterin/6-carboxytetrahydropterin synthase
VISVKHNVKATVIRKTHFNAAHRLHVPQWSDEENRAFFGLCNNANYHGHNYDLEVSLRGDIDPITGYVYDMGLLKDLIQSEIVDRFDHKNLNLDTEEFAQLNPSAENIAMVIWNKLRNNIDASYELEVTLYETPRNIVKFNG